MSEFPILSTARLDLRELHDGDNAAYCTLLTDGDEGYFITDTPISASQVPTKLKHNRAAFLEGTTIYWAVTLNDVFVGFVAIHESSSDRPALSYATSKAWRRQRIAAEAISAVISYAFDTLDARGLIACTHLENLPSAYLLRSLGFRDDGIAQTPQGQRRQFSLKRTDKCPD